MKNNNASLNQWTCRFALAGITLIGLPAVAADATGLDSSVIPGPATAATDASGSLPVTVSVGGSEQFKSEIDKDNAGSFTLTRANASIRIPVKLNDEIRLNTSFRYGLDYYSWSDIPANNTQWDYVNTLQGAAILAWQPQDGNFSYFGGGFAKMSAESGVALNRAATGGGIAGLNYKVSDTLSIGGGLAITSQLEENAAILPILLAKWQFADNWRLDLGMTDVATSGYGVDVKWLFSKEWEFGVGAQVHKNSFRIEGNKNDQLGNSTSNSKDAIATEQAATIYLDSTWHASDKVDFGAFVGIASGGKLKLADSSGNHEQKEDYKAAAILGLKASLRF
jgi:hypothetical protein